MSEGSVERIILSQSSYKSVEISPTAPSLRLGGYVFRNRSPSRDRRLLSQVVCHGPLLNSNGCGLSFSLNDLPNSSNSTHMKGNGHKERFVLKRAELDDRLNKTCTTLLSGSDACNPRNFTACEIRQYC